MRVRGTFGVAFLGLFVDLFLFENFHGVELLLLVVILFADKEDLSECSSPDYLFNLEVLKVNRLREQFPSLLTLVRSVVKMIYY